MSGFAGKLKMAWERRQSYVELGELQAFRLITKEELQWPMAVDIYCEGKYSLGKVDAKNAPLTSAVMQQYDFDIDEESLIELENVLQEKFGVSRFFYKKRFKVKDTPESGGELYEKPEEMVVSEYGHKFLINLNNYLDTGLFLDHRDTRMWVQSKVEANPGGEVLNLFAYTGSFSVYAAGGGAGRTHTVDLSKTYCDWARRNLDLNDYDKTKHWVYRMDTFEFYKYALRKKLSFDLIIIDPPTFSRNKGDNFSVQRDHYALIAGAAELLNKGGEIVFSNNCLDFEMDKRISEKFFVENVQEHTVPPDFWVDSEIGEWDSQNQIHNCFVIRPKSS